MSDDYRYNDIFKLNDITVNGRVLGNSGGVLTMAFQVPDEDHESFSGLSLQDEIFFNTMAGIQIYELDIP